MAPETVNKDDLLNLHPREIRALTRERKWTGSTEGLAEGYAQANLVIIPKKVAFDFLLFCMRNPKPCPIVEVTDPGSPIIRQVAKNADLRTDLPRYRVYREGEMADEVEDISGYWRDDLVGFLIGCSYTFESALLNANIPLKHMELNKPGPLYITNIQCVSAGQFSGPMVVSMRPVKHNQVARTVQITSRFPATHGAPVHIGSPDIIGVNNLDNVCYDTSTVPVENDEVPVFWGCGCTPQAVALASNIDYMITHKAGHLFLTDTLSERIASL